MILHVEYPAKPARKEGGWATLARWLGWATLAVFAVLIVMALLVAFTAAAVVGLIITTAMLILRLGAPKRPLEGDLVLEGRRTPEGWVVEATPRSR